VIAYLHAAILGLVQGITEFLPVSSSGHLILIPKLFGWPDQGTAFDITMHVATLSAVAIYFRADIGAMLKSIFGRAINRDSQASRRLAMNLGIATIPAIIGGLLLGGFVETAGRNVVLVASLMIFVGLLFLLIERIAVLHKDLGKLTPTESLAIGIAQAAALLPGVSRSGATIITGMYNGLKRESATRFSFLLSIPAIILAAGYSALQLATGHETLAYPPLALLIGFVAALVSGLAAISFMMRFVKTYRLNAFAYYRIIFGIALLVLYFYGGFFH